MARRILNPDWLGGRVFRRPYLVYQVSEHGVKKAAKTATKVAKIEKVVEADKSKAPEETEPSTSKNV